MSVPPRNRRVGVSSTSSDEPMPGTRTPIVRVVALVALVVEPWLAARQHRHALAAIADASFDGVTAGLRVNASVHAPLLCVVDVFKIASGNLGLPGKANL